MEDKIARFISVVMHPMFMLTWAIILMFNLNAYFVMIVPRDLKWSIILLIFGNTALLPALLIWIMAKRNIISSLTLPLREERTYPFLIFAVFYASTLYLMRNIGLPQIYYLFVIGGLATIIIAVIVNLFWKVSIHMIGIGGISGGFLVMSYKGLMNEPVLIISLFLAAGLVGFARLKSNSHTPAQVYVGYLSGLIAVAAIFLIF